MAKVKVRTGVYSAAYTGDTSTLVLPPGYGIGVGTQHAIIGCHGHGGYSYQYAPHQGFQPGWYAQALADDVGIVTLGVDHSAINAWGDPNAMRAMDDAYTYLTGTVKIPNTKVGLIGFSMGGPTALNWALRNPSKVAGIWLISPATDLRFWRDASGSYTPTYSTAGITQGAFTTELNSAYGPSTTANGAVTIPASGGAGVTVNLASGGGKGFADATTLGGGATPQATFGGVNFTYTGKTDSSLTGCVSTTASTISVTNGGAITGAWATQWQNYSPWQLASAYSTANGITFPIEVMQASDDTTVPPAMNNDATNGWVARTGNTNITLRSPAPTGNHTGQIGPAPGVPQSEVNAFFSGLTTW